VKLLVLSTEPVDAGVLRRTLGDGVEGAQVLVVSPSVNESKLAFWVSDSDEAIGDADDVQEETVANLRADGVQASGTTGESEPLTALQDALATFPADRVVVFVRPEDEQRYKEDDVVGEAGRRFGVPVEQATVAPQ